MKRRLLQERYVLGIILGLLILVEGCGTSSPGMNPTPNPVPAIGTLSPSSATAGAAAQTLTINGSNFLASSTVTYNAVAHTATFVSASQLTIQLSASDQATAGTYAVAATNPAPGGGGSNSANFTVNNPTPTVTTLSPASANAGAAAQTLTINGTNFVSNSTVTYNAAAHTATYVSATQLTIQLSAGDQAAAGTYALVVTNPAPGGGASNSVNFTVDNPMPTISSLTPASATAGAAAQTLTINGTNFLSTSTVTYNAAAHIAKFVSATQLTVQLSAADQAMAGTFAVVVTNPAPGGGVSNSVNFTINNPVATISSLSPASATAGAAAQTLTIIGTNFVSNSITTYNGVAHTVTFVSSTQLTIMLSASDQATAGAYPVVVINPTPGGGASNAVNFTVSSTNNPVPTITSLSPSSENAGAAAQSLTINGTGFIATSTVTYGGVAHVATLVSSTQLAITLSASDQAAAGTYAVVVINPAPGGGASNAVNFTVSSTNNPVPTITSLSPSSTDAGAAAQTLTINGTGFIATSTVTYNGVAHAATFVSSTQLTIMLSASDQATAGSYSIVVTNPAPGGGASNAVGFTITSGALSVTTTALPGAFLGVSYAAQAAASGGVPPYTWSISAGALPPGLALDSSSGVISGVPVGATGSASVTLEVTDSKSANATSPSMNLTIGNDTISVCESGNESALIGQYAFNLSGYNSSGFQAVVGSLTFNGIGGIPFGEFDINSNGAAAETNTTITAARSSYTVGASNRGCATFVTASGTTFTTRFTLGALSSGVATQGRIIEFDPAGSSSFIAAGQILQQNTTAFSAGPAGSFAHLVTGWDPTSSTRIVCAGVLTRTATSGGAGNVGGLDQICNDGGTYGNVTPAGTVGSYTAPDSNGRFTQSTKVSGLTSENAEYMVSANQALVVSITFDGSNDVITAGESYLQNGAGSFTNLSVTGDYAWYQMGVDGSTGGWTEFGYFDADGGTTSISIEAYVDTAGSTGQTAATCTFHVDSNGRMTINPSGTCLDPPLVYLISNSQAILLSEDDRVKGGLAFLQNVPAGGYSPASMAGAFFGGTTEVVNQNSRAENYLIDVQNSTTFPNLFILGDEANINSSDELADQFTEQLVSFGSSGIMMTQSTATAAAETVGIAINSTSFLIATDIGNAYPTFVLFGPSTPDGVAISLSEPTTAQTVATNATVAITVSLTDAPTLDVTWLLNGLQSGSAGAAAYGSVSGSSGSFTYAAPASVPSPATFDVTAVSNTDASKTVSFSVTVTDPGH
jgi:hypothetical protein